jgi:LPS export ABC transporter permease LptG
MRILDRYTVRTFMLPWLCVTLGFVFLFIIIDLIDRLNYFLDAGVPALDIVLYYLRFLPTVWIYIGPITLLLGLLFALYQLTRHNEIIAMRASGISIYRVMLPFLLLGVVFSLITVHISENVAPKALAWTDQYMENLRRPDENQMLNLRFRDPESNRTWDIQELNLETFEIRNVTVVQRRLETDTIQYVIGAQRGVWMDSHWAFYDVVTQNHSVEGWPQGPPVSDPVRLMQDLTESPQRIVRETMPFEHMTSREMREFLANRPVSERTRADLMTQLHMRHAQPWLCLVTVMLAVPFSTHTARKGVFAGVLLCILLFFSLIFTLSLFKALGQGQQVAPWLAGWFPTLFFGSIGVFLLRRLR